MRYVVIIGTQRSGTTVLRSLLQTHAEIHTFGEVFLHRHAHMRECYYHYLRERAKTDPEVVVANPDRCCAIFDDYLAYLASLADERTRILVIDCKYNFLLGLNPSGDLHWGQHPYLLQQFQKQSCRIIHVIRENVLASYVSSLLSMKNQVWATDSLDRIAHRKTEVPTARLLEILRHRRAEQAYFEKLLAGFDALTIRYESMFVETRFAPVLLKQLAEFLDISNEFQNMPVLKKIALPVNQAIENLTVVQQLLDGTEFANLLE